MKSVGEAMAIGRNFTEALQKALRSLESPNAVFDWHQEWVELDKAALLEEIRTPHDGRLKMVMDAIRAGATPEEIFEATGIDPWFVDQLALINEVAAEVTAAAELTPDLLRLAKRHGFSDAQIGKIRGMTADVVRGVRHALGIRPVYKTVDTCAAEFAAATPYHYSSYDEETEVAPREHAAVIILGSGPNRIGQGIEFDYSCVHASMALARGRPGYETIMVNCNPETVSTDYDTSDRLYFEPLTLEDVLEIVHAEQLAGPSPGSSASSAARRRSASRRASRTPGSRSSAPRRRRSTSPRSAAPSAACSPTPGCRRPSTAWRRPTPRRSGIAARDRLPGAGAPVVRPGRARHGDRLRRRRARGLHRYVATAISPEHPVLVDRFIDDAVEIDVDAIFDGEELFLGGVMEHIEEAGIHSGDSSCALPPITLGAARSTGSGGPPRRSRAGSACAGCSTSSSRSAPTCSTSSRPTRAPPHGAVRLQGHRRRRWPRRRPG